METLECMERQGNGKEVIMKQCNKSSGKQKIQCHAIDGDFDGMEIGWRNNRYLHLSGLNRYAISKNVKSSEYPQVWTSEPQVTCKTSTAYKGIVCYK
jgi:hypothetical protein